MGPEAEADPWYYYNGYAGYYPYTYGYGYPYHTYNHVPVVKAAVEEKADEETEAVKPYTYYANSGGAVHIVKREAEAEADADPKSWYGYAGYHPYTYGYRYGHYGGYYPYSYGYRAGVYSPYYYGGYYYGK